MICYPFLQKQFTKMANTKLKKKKKGVIGANGLNNDAGRNDRLVTISGGVSWIMRRTCDQNYDYLCVVANI